MRVCLTQSKILKCLNHLNNVKMNLISQRYSGDILSSSENRLSGTRERSVHTDQDQRQDLLSYKRFGQSAGLAYKHDSTHVSHERRRPLRDVRYSHSSQPSHQILISQHIQSSRSATRGQDRAFGSTVSFDSHQAVVHLRHVRILQDKIQ